MNRLKFVIAAFAFLGGPVALAPAMARPPIIVICPKTCTSCGVLTGCQTSASRAMLQQDAAITRPW